QRAMQFLLDDAAAVIMRVVFKVTESVQLLLDLDSERRDRAAFLIMRRWRRVSELVGLEALERVAEALLDSYDAAEQAAEDVTPLAQYRSYGEVSPPRPTWLPNQPTVRQLVWLARERLRAEWTPPDGDSWFRAIIRGARDYLRRSALGNQADKVMFQEIAEMTPEHLRQKLSTLLASDRHKHLREKLARLHPDSDVDEFQRTLLSRGQYEHPMFTDFTTITGELAGFRTTIVDMQGQATTSGPPQAPGAAGSDMTTLVILRSRDHYMPAVWEENHPFPSRLLPTTPRASVAATPSRHRSRPASPEAVVRTGRTTPVADATPTTPPAAAPWTPGTLPTRPTTPAAGRSPTRPTTPAAGRSPARPTTPAGTPPSTTSTPPARATPGPTPPSTVRGRRPADLDYLVGTPPPSSFPAAMRSDTPRSQAATYSRRPSDTAGSDRGSGVKHQSRSRSRVRWDLPPQPGGTGGDSRAEPPRDETRTFVMKAARWLLAHPLGDSAVAGSVDVDEADDARVDRLTLRQQAERVAELLGSRPGMTVTDLGVHPPRLPLPAGALVWIGEPGRPAHALRAVAGGYQWYFPQSGFVRRIANDASLPLKQGNRYVMAVPARDSPALTGAAQDPEAPLRVRPDESLRPAPAQRARLGDHPAGSAARSLVAPGTATAGHTVRPVPSHSPAAWSPPPRAAARPARGSRSQQSLVHNYGLNFGVQEFLDDQDLDLADVAGDGDCFFNAVVATVGAASIERAMVLLGRELGLPTRNLELGEVTGRDLRTFVADVVERSARPEDPYYRRLVLDPFLQQPVPDDPSAFTLAGVIDSLRRLGYYGVEYGDILPDVT
ncbi:MAG TPA: hypothetical protein VHA75_00565, partial [Rugosimonospora sp.]|nr:hypothetical protein [Rugosimonospora sp.]